MYSGLKYLFKNPIKYRSNNRELSGGLPHSEIHGSKLILSSPWLIAEYHVFHRLLLPRHSPNALLALDLIQKKKDTTFFVLPPNRLLEDMNSSGLRPSQFGVGSIETAQLVTKGSHSSEPKAYFPAFHPGTHAADVGRPHMEDRRHVGFSSPSRPAKTCSLVFLRRK